jgi:hypothetical protein
MGALFTEQFGLSFGNDNGLESDSICALFDWDGTSKSWDSVLSMKLTVR